MELTDFVEFLVFIEDSDEFQEYRDQWDGEYDEWDPDMCFTEFLLTINDEEEADFRRRFEASNRQL